MDETVCAALRPHLLACQQLRGSSDTTVFPAAAAGVHAAGLEEGAEPCLGPTLRLWRRSRAEGVLLHERRDQGRMAGSVEASQLRRHAEPERMGGALGNAVQRGTTSSSAIASSRRPRGSMPAKKRAEPVPEEEEEEEDTSGSEVIGSCPRRRRWPLPLASLPCR